MNKAVLLEQQKKKAMEMEQRNKVVYDNGGFERNENHNASEPDYATTPPSASPAVPEKLEQEMRPKPSTEEDTNHTSSNTCL